MGAASRPPPRPAALEIDEETGLGEAYMRSLVRAQLRLGLAALAAVVLPLGALPAVLLAVPSLSQVALLGVPLPWLLLGAGVYPALWGVARWYAAAAERAERDFVDLVGRRE